MLHEAPRTVTAIIEIRMGSHNTHEIDSKTGRIKLDRVLYSSVHYPSDYRFIPETLAPDGDTLDILLVVHAPTFPGCLVEAWPVGGLDVEDEKGSDFKVLAVPVGDRRFAGIRSLDQLEPHWLLEIETFFATYTLLEPGQTEVRGWHSPGEAWQQIDDARRRYRS
jgi:inorganic pyrophosphatase